MCEWMPEEIRLRRKDGTRRTIRGESVTPEEVFTHQYGDEDVVRYRIVKRLRPHVWVAEEWSAA